jgi:hypothetical protein
LPFFENKPGRCPSNLEIPNPTGDFSASWFDGSLFLIRRDMTLKSFAQGPSWTTRCSGAEFILSLPLV